MKFLRPSLIVGPLPVTLLNGTTADATQVMADLNWIINQVNANAAPLATTALTNANNNFTTVQSGQPATQPANFPIASQVQNQAFNTLSSVLGTNTITARVSSLPLSAYAVGQVFTFFPSNANSGAATLNIDGVGARSILNMGSALSGAEMQTYRPQMVVFDNAVNAFDLLNGTPYVKGPNIVAAATLNLDGAFGDYSQVDGTANITALTLSPGRQKLLEFTSSPLISHSATLIMGSNYTPNPGDTAVFRGEAGGAVRMVGLRRASQVRAPKITVVTATGAGTYTPDTGVVRADVEINGAGGGGGAQTTNAGTAGGNTTFGPLTASGGGAGANGDAGGGPTPGAGGAASGGDINRAGGSGGQGGAGTLAGGNGGISYFGGAGFGAITTVTPVAAAANSGSGGGGGRAGGGGGAGGYVRKIFFQPAITPFSVGAKGTGGAAGTAAGGDGADGTIIITEYYS